MGKARSPAERCPTSFAQGRRGYRIPHGRRTPDPVGPRWHRAKGGMVAAGAVSGEDGTRPRTGAPGIPARPPPGRRGDREPGAGGEGSGCRGRPPSGGWRRGASAKGPRERANTAARSKGGGPASGCLSPRDEPQPCRLHGVHRQGASDHRRNQRGPAPVPAPPRGRGPIDPRPRAESNGGRTSRSSEPIPRSASFRRREPP